MVMLAFGIGGGRFEAETGQDWKILLAPAEATTAGVTYHTTDNVNYQVTAGKKFVIVAVKYRSDVAFRTLSVEQSDDADASTNVIEKVVIAIPITPAAFDLDEWITIPNIPSVAASKFINLTTTSTTTSGEIYMIIGYEEDT